MTIVWFTSWNERVRLYIPEQLNILKNSPKMKNINRLAPVSLDNDGSDMKVYRRQISVSVENLSGVTKALFVNFSIMGNFDVLSNV